MHITFPACDSKASISVACDTRDVIKTSLSMGGDVHVPVNGDLGTVTLLRKMC